MVKSCLFLSFECPFFEHSLDSTVGQRSHRSLANFKFNLIKIHLSLGKGTHKGEGREQPYLTICKFGNLLSSALRAPLPTTRTLTRILHFSAQSTKRLKFHNPIPLQFWKQIIYDLNCLVGDTMEQKH